MDNSKGKYNRVYHSKPYRSVLDGQHSSQRGTYVVFVWKYGPRHALFHMGEGNIQKQYNRREGAVLHRRPSFLHLWFDQRCAVWPC